jgi:hypothetical protein
MHDDHYAAILDSRSDDGSVPETYVHALKLMERQPTGGGGLAETYQIVDRHCKECISKDCVYSMSFLPARLIDVNKATAEEAERKDFIVAYGDHREIDRHNLKRKSIIQVSLNNLLLIDEARPEHAWHLSTRRKPEMQIPESFLARRTTTIEREFLKSGFDFIRGYLQVRHHAGGSAYLVVTALKHVDDAVTFDAGFVEDKHRAELSDAYRPYEELITVKEWSVHGRTYRVSPENSYIDDNRISIRVSSSEAHDQCMNEP